MIEQVWRIRVQLASHLHLLQSLYQNLGFFYFLLPFAEIEPEDVSHRNIEVGFYLLRKWIGCLKKLGNGLGEEVLCIWKLDALSEEHVVFGRWVHLLFWYFWVVLDRLGIFIYLEIPICQIFVNQGLDSHLLAFLAHWYLQQNSNSLLWLFLHHCHHTFNKSSIYLNRLVLLELQMLGSPHRMICFVEISTFNVYLNDFQKGAINCNFVIIILQCLFK